MSELSMFLDTPNYHVSWNEVSDFFNNRWSEIGGVYPEDLRLVYMKDGGTVALHELVSYSDKSEMLRVIDKDGSKVIVCVTRFGNYSVALTKNDRVISSMGGVMTRVSGVGVSVLNIEQIKHLIGTEETDSLGYTLDMLYKLSKTL